MNTCSASTCRLSTSLSLKCDAACRCAVSWLVFARWARNKAAATSLSLCSFASWNCCSASCLAVASVCFDCESNTSILASPSRSSLADCDCTAAVCSCSMASFVLASSASAAEVTVSRTCLCTLVWRASSRALLARVWSSSDRRLCKSCSDSTAWLARACSASAARAVRRSWISPTARALRVSRSSSAEVQLGLSSENGEGRDR